jgi:hypothetical protein
MRKGVEESRHSTPSRSLKHTAIPFPPPAGAVKGTRGRKNIRTEPDRPLFNVEQAEEQMEAYTPAGRDGRRLRGCEKTRREEGEEPTDRKSRGRVGVI